MPPQTVTIPGGSTEHYPFPDLLCTNICFGGDDMQTAWVTASGTGKLYKTPLRDAYWTGHESRIL